MWLQLFVTKHEDCMGRARKGEVTACVDFSVSLSCVAWMHTKGRSRKSQEMIICNISPYNSMTYITLQNLGSMKQIVSCQDFPISI